MPGRFVPAEALIPQPAPCAALQGCGATNPMAWDRYAYALNNPVNFIDPTGHFTEKAIYEYLFSLYNDEIMAKMILMEWQQDTEWWIMIRKAKAGDNLIGIQTIGYNDPDPFMYTFQGKGKSKLKGITPYGRYGSNNVTLDDIFSNPSSDYCAQGNGGMSFHWVGLLSNMGGEPSITYSRNYKVTTNKRPDSPSNELASIFSGGFVGSFAGGVLRVAMSGHPAGVLVWFLSTVIGGFAGIGFVDTYDLQNNDYNFWVGPIYFNLQDAGSAPGYILEHMEILGCWYLYDLSKIKR